MGSRILPIDCEHGVTVDWGDFGPCQGFCAENGHDQDHCPDIPGCEQCEAEAARWTRVLVEELEALRDAEWSSTVGSPFDLAVQALLTRIPSDRQAEEK